jgi:hypothetical protein
VKIAFAAPSVRYTINVAQIPQKKFLPVILWLADRLLRVVEEQEDTTVIENADLQGTLVIGSSRHTFTVKHDSF